MLTVISEAKAASPEASDAERTREAIVRQGREEEMKTKRRADILYGSDEEYYAKYPPKRPIENYIIPDENGVIKGGVEYLDYFDNRNKKDNIEQAQNSSISTPETKKNKYGLGNKLFQAAAEFGLGTAYNPAGYWAANNIAGPDTAGMVDLAHKKPLNPRYAANTIKLSSYHDISNTADRIYFKEKLDEQYKDYGFDIEKINGRIFPENTEPSRSIAQDLDFLDTIRVNKNKILNGEMVSGNFPVYADKKASNWHYAIGHYDLRNGYLDERGNLHIQVCDTYDFNKNNSTVLNQAGRNQMIKGNLLPSFSIHNVVVPFYALKDIWDTF